ncbi:hypothetical protein Slala03_81390 [Streptomyces lavendulae subsp. lavendulae]|uniref:hypothetical protein n=1 Tax=Streptomyces lavendulae TaxID=1914 RepID=UPI0024A0CEAE|nr:hypothetical protein [Streptomyces lavendulae]GLV88450.1 hypothetical protein Slala03_81390 [Streptomyces lavendulae subsp. lavendulae]
MTEPHRWRLLGQASDGYSGAEARSLLVRRLDWGTQETLFEDGRGRLLSVVTNGERARVALVDGAGGPGEHLVDPRGEGVSGGYLSSSGRVDTYPDGETVPFPLGCRAVEYFIEHDAWPHDVMVAQASE